MVGRPLARAMYFSVAVLFAGRAGRRASRSAYDPESSDIGARSPRDPQRLRSLGVRALGRPVHFRNLTQTTGRGESREGGVGYAARVRRDRVRVCVRVPRD